VNAYTNLLYAESTGVRKSSGERQPSAHQLEKCTPEEGGKLIVGPDRAWEHVELDMSN
jgi:hypothetical protein